MFSVDPKLYTSMFSVPSRIADKMLKLSSGDQLKVILCILRNPEADTETIAKATGLSTGTVEESVEYWTDCGIIKQEGQTNKAVTTESENTEIKSTPVISPVPFVNPTQDEINKALKSSRSFKNLCREAQEIFGRTLGYSMQVALYRAVHFYGLRPDVTNMLLHYAKVIDKTSLSDIEKIADYWSANGITSMKLADDFIAESEKAIREYKKLARDTGNTDEAPTFVQCEMLTEWLRWGYSHEMIKKAYDIMKTEKESDRLNYQAFRHMNATIKRWHRDGIKTAADIEKGTKKTRGTKNTPKETSFDTDLAEKNARESAVDFGTKKNKKRKRGS